MTAGMKAQETRPGENQTEGDTIFVLNKASDSFKRAKRALKTYEKGTLSGLSNEQMKRAIRGNWPHEDAAAQKD